MHLRTGRGLEKAVSFIDDLGLDTVQIFTGNPSAWRSAPLDPQATALFRRSMEERRIHPILAHAMYLINLAGANPDFYRKSKDALANELDRASQYGCRYVVTHIGSHMGGGRDVGIGRVVSALDEVLERVPNGMICLLELSAGGGAYIGSRFEDLAEILDRLPGHTDRLGVCFDTAHAYASGYDVSGEEGMTAVLDQMVDLIPAERVRACHCNDTTVELGGKADRHHQIGQGNIGPGGFKALLHYEPLAHCAFLLETPGEEMLEGRENLETLRRLAA
jgi:deoxyribonuclease-4